VTTAIRQRIVLAAGGTGGHMFPAEALATELIGRGCAVALVTDRRGGGFGDKMPAVEIYRISAGGLAGRSITRRIRGAVQLGVGVLQARWLLARLSPAAAVGFGGYASVPTILAASFAGIATVIHEQNAVLGRANRLLAKRATRIAAAFPELRGPGAANRIVVTGNPVRPAIAALGAEPYAPPEPEGEFRLLVVGGSLGARVMSRVVPEAIGRLPEAIRRHLRVVQQCRADDLDGVRAAYRALAVEAELAPFFTDIPERLRGAHLVIARAGASTIAELTAAGRPAILIPFPFATDDHQMANAEAISRAGAAWPVAETKLTADGLSARLQAAIAAPDTLAAAAAAARALGRRNAAARLADIVISVFPNHGLQAANNNPAERDTATGRREPA
jgi:UDP-N-acetylglucosamine--N-acetylmuramyl-(pentapeptide) pyrophosphoryl-undecaprenol N-acetylglucosamine transferase